MHLHRLLLLTTLVAAPGVALATPLYTVTDLGTLGGSYSAGAAINALGQVTGSSTLASNTARHAFLWDGGMHDLGTLGGTINSVGADLNASGQVTGSSYTFGGARHAFLWDGSMHDLGTLGGRISFGNGINDGGQVAGFSSISGNSAVHAFLWQESTGMKDLGTLGGTSSNGFGINDAGEVTGYSDINPSAQQAFLGQHRHAFLWQQSTGMQDLGTLAGTTDSVGADINASGQVTGSSFSPNGIHHAFLWGQSTGMQDLGTLGGQFSDGYGINARGEVTGSYGSYLPEIISLHAFLWNGTGMQDLNSLIDPASGWTLDEGRDINDAGQITGSGFFRGRTHAFLLTPVPEPATLALLGSGLGSLAMLLRRRQYRRGAGWGPHLCERRDRSEQEAGV